MTSASDIMRFLFRFGVSVVDGSAFFSISPSNSLQKSSAIQKISVTLLSVIMIQYLLFDTSKLLNISDITKRIGNFFKLPIQLFYGVPYPELAFIMFDKYGVEEAAFGMACAKNYGTKHKRSDLRTPEGFFSVKKIQNSTAWHYVDDNGVVSDKTGEYGPRFIRLNTPVTNSIGIHGTCAPWSIGGRRSHGCIRIANENIMKLVEMVDSGMPVIVTPGRRDMAVNKKEGYDIPSISTIPGKSHMVLKERREVVRADVSLSQDTLSDVQAQVEERPLEAAL